MSDSIFTQIIKGEIPCHKIYEDEHTLAFLDIHPAQPGHTIVIPKTQTDHLWDLSEDAYHAVMSASRRVAQRLREKLPVKRVGVIVEGLEVPHAHIKLIPFSTSQEFLTIADPNAEPDNTALAAMAQKLAF